MTHAGKTPLMIVVFGKWKTGKSTLGATCPPPLQVWDVEAGSGHHAPGAIRIGSFKDFKTRVRGLQNQVDTRSVVVDSITALQDLYITETFGDEKLEWPDYSQILRALSMQLTKLRGYQKSATHALEVVYLIAQEKEYQDHKLAQTNPKRASAEAVVSPSLMGQMRSRLMYLADAVAHSRLEGGKQVLRFSGGKHLAVGHRFGQGFPEELTNPTVPSIQSVIKERIANG